MICSPAAAASQWVEEECRYFVERHGPDAVILVFGRGRSEGEPISAHHWALPHEPFWVDLRSKKDRGICAVARIAAGVIGTSFDLVWQREKRRLIRSGALAILLLGLGVAAAAGIITMGARYAPKAQVEAFAGYLESAEQIDDRENEQEERKQWQIVLADDLNGDSKLDFIVTMPGGMRCGTGGCPVFVFVTEHIGSYEMVVNLHGHSMPSIQASITEGFKDILANYYFIGNNPLWSKYVWDGSTYKLQEHTYCLITMPGGCSSVRIEPFENDYGHTISEDAIFVTEPGDDVPQLRGRARGVIGKIKDYDLPISKEIMARDWYLAHMVNWEAAAFVEGKYVTPDK